MIPPFFRLLLICTLFFIHSANAAFSETLVVRRTLPVTPDEAYQCTLQAWKENLGLFLVPPPIFLSEGDPVTGAGLVLLRIPPAGLREGIVGREALSNNEGWVMTYRVLNPSLWTWPVQDHLGEIAMRQVDDEGDLGIDSSGSDGKDKEVATSLEWSVRWTPLLTWLPFFPEALKVITTMVIETAANHVVRLCEAPSLRSEL